MIIIASILGAIFRRWWGGWYSPNALVKRILGFVLPSCVCVSLFGISWLSVILPGFILFGWLMPYHGWSLNMGRDPARPLWQCLSVMGLQYGGLTCVSGLIWNWLLPTTGGLYYATFGIIVPFGYWLSWETWERFKLKPWGECPVGNVFVDGPGAYSELMLGSVLVGGIPIAARLAQLI